MFNLAVIKNIFNIVSKTFCYLTELKKKPFLKHCQNNKYSKRLRLKKLQNKSIAQLESEMLQIQFCP